MKYREEDKTIVVKNNLRAQITILAGLLFTIVVSVVTVSIESAVSEVSKLKVDMAGNLAMEKEFAKYFRPLLDEYDIFLVKNEALEESIFTNIKDNIPQKQTFINLDIKSLSIDKVYTPLQNNAQGIKEEILDYMKYGAYSDIVNSFIKGKEHIEKAEKTQKIVDEIVECDSVIEKIEYNTLELVELVEGLRVSENGFEIRNKSPQAIEGSFFKKMVIGPADQKLVGVDNDKIYNVLSNKYIDVNSIINDILEICEDIQGNDQNLEAINEIGTYNQVYQRDKNKLIELLRDENEKAEEALNKITDIKTGKIEMSGKVQGLQNTIINSANILDADSIQFFNENIQELNQYESSDTSLCNVEQMSNAILENEKIIEAAINITQLFPESLSQENINDIKDIASQSKNKLIEFCSHNMKFDYSKVNFTGNSSGLSAIKKVYKALKDGTAGLVIDNWDIISDKVVKYNDLSSSNIESYEGDFTQETFEDNILYNEYIVGHFSSYGDFQEESSERIDIASELNYEIEFMIGGTNSDKENIKEVIEKMVVLRSGTNFTYLFTDKEKSLEAYGVAAGLLGFTGIHTVIKIGQYLVMTAWAYGEAIMDIKELINGNKIPLIKTKQNWKLSLQNLMKMKLSSDTGEKKSDIGLDYNDYLKMLLYIEVPSKKYFRTMDLMEIKMISKGFSEFRMKNYIYKLEGKTLSTIGKAKLHYENKIQYSY